jgi:dephospho-CoA kinase
MVVTGIIGGVASGKSTVSSILRSLGAEVLDADRIGHQVLLDEEVKRRIRARWGDRVFGVDGEILRPRLGEIVFRPDQPDELQALEEITHPEIGRRIRRKIDEVRSGSMCPMLVLDAPVMIKAGWHRECDVILFIDTSYPRRLEYARSRGWDESELDRREALQTGLAMKRELATHVITNNGTVRELKEQVLAFWSEVISGRKSCSL